MSGKIVLKERKTMEKTEADQIAAVVTSIATIGGDRGHARGQDPALVPITLPTATRNTIATCVQELAATASAATNLI